MQSVMLDVFESPQIQEKISSLSRRLDQSAVLRELAILVMVLQVLGKPADVDFLMSVLGTDTPNQSVFRKDETLREIISVNSGRIQARSAVLAEYLLRGVFTGGNVLDVLKKLIRYAHDHGDHRNGYGEGISNVYYETIRFGNVQAMFSEKGRLHFVREYYEYAKTLHRMQNDPHFGYSMPWPASHFASTRQLSSTLRRHTPSRENGLASTHHT